MHFKTLFIILLTCSSLWSQIQEKPIVVLELFTSQGCSSCPPADKVLLDLSQVYKNENVFFLSYHVDYWNRLGWNDPFSTPENTIYQQTYAELFNSSSIYTPQLVINGSTHFTGSHRSKAVELIDQTLKSDQNPSKISINGIDRHKDTIQINFDYMDTSVQEVIVALIIKEKTTEIKRGENLNRTLTNSHIVLDFDTIISDDFDAQLTVPKDISQNDELFVIVYAKNELGKIISAAKASI